MRECYTNSTKMAPEPGSLLEAMICELRVPTSSTVLVSLRVCKRFRDGNVVLDLGDVVNSFTVPNEVEPHLAENMFQAMGIVPVASSQLREEACAKVIGELVGLWASDCEDFIWRVPRPEPR